jgi:Na+/proline symporter
MATSGFSVVDYVIFALMLAISAGIGIFYGCFGNKTGTAKEMLVANRQMTVFPTAMSLLASFMSGITILGNPAESYNYGTLYIWCAVAHIFVAIVTANVFIPVSFY